MITGLQLVLAILVLGAVIWIGDAIAGGIDEALGEKPMRDRDACAPAALRFVLLLFVGAEFAGLSLSAP